MSEDCRQELAANVEQEMLDDPRWVEEHTGPFDWQTYFQCAGMPWTFGTAYNILGYVEITGQVVEVYKADKGKYHKISENFDTSLI